MKSDLCPIIKQRERKEGRKKRKEKKKTRKEKKRKEEQKSQAGVRDLVWNLLPSWITNSKPIFPNEAWFLYWS